MLQKTKLRKKLLSLRGTTDKDSYHARLEKNLQLNNFVNSIKAGYLELYKVGLFGKVRWDSKFCVLSNVGLLYWANVLEPPQDLFPVIDCEVIRQSSAETGTGYFTFKLIYTRKQVTFRCGSNGECGAWFDEICKLQHASQEKRQEMKTAETRLTTIARQMGVPIKK